MLNCNAILFWQFYLSIYLLSIYIYIRLGDIRGLDGDHGGRGGRPRGGHAAGVGGIAPQLLLLRHLHRDKQYNL